MAYAAGPAEPDSKLQQGREVTTVAPEVPLLLPAYISVPRESEHSTHLLCVSRSMSHVQRGKAASGTACGNA